MQLLLTSTAPSNIGQGGDTIIQTQKLCVTIRMIQSFPYHELSSLRRDHAFFTFKFPATRFVRVILDQGAMSSSQGRRKKKPEFVRVILVQAKLPYRSRKKELPNSDLDCHSLRRGHAAISRVTPSLYRAVQQCPEEETPSSLRRAMRQCPAEDKASGSIRSSYLWTSIGGHHRFAPREHHGRSFWRETWR